MNKARVREILMAITIGILATFLPIWEWSGELDRIMASIVISMILIWNL